MQIGMGLGLNRGRKTIFTTVNDFTTYGTGILTGATLTAANAANRAGVANTASSLFEDTSIGFHAIQMPVTLTPGLKYRLTGYFKQNGRVNAFFGNQTSGQGINVDINAMSITSPSGTITSPSVTASTNGYAKCQFTFVNSSLGATTMDILLGSDAVTLSYQGVITNGFILDEIILETVS